jgi:hypothetical protein
MRTGSPKTRLIVFGPLYPGSEILASRLARNALERVATGQRPTLVPDELVKHGLLTHRSDSSWTAGPRFICPPKLRSQRDRMVRYASTCSVAYLTTRIVELKAELGRMSGEDPEQAWQRLGFLTVAGLLLDLHVGESLFRHKLIGKQAPGWWIWAVPVDASTPAFGVRCIHDQATRLGAGICWHDSITAAVRLPEPEELKLLDRLLRGETVTPSVLLHMRYLGWLQGTQPAAPVFDEHDRLVAVLQEIADRIVETAYAPVHHRVRSNGLKRDQQRLLLARMIMERTLDPLITSAEVPAPGLNTMNRWFWRGAGWSLAEPRA